MPDATTFDLIAIGGGLAGLTAAARARELGRTALVLEADADPAHLCASRVNGGIFHLGFRSVDAPPDELERIVTRATHGFVAPPIARAFAHNAGRAARWLADAGVAFTRIEPDEGWKDHVFAPLGFYGSASFAWKGLGADTMMNALEAHYAAVSGTLLRGVRATGLVIEDGRCVGVTADGPQGPRTYRAHAVVLADGGFQGNPDMLRRFVGAHPETLKLRGPPSAVGDGIRYAEAAGAKLIGMETFYGHMLCADTLTRDGLCPFPFVDLLAAAGVMVDATGKRFVDEGRGPHAMSHALAHHGNGLATIVFDDAMWESAGRDFICPPNPMLVDAGGTLHRAGELDALARLAELPADTLRATVDAHNAAIAANTLDRLAPPRSAAKHKPQPFAKPPYYAVRACVAITHTMGGVAVDDHARVLDRRDRPIRGLYAAGSTCGGLEGGPDSAYLGGLVKACVFGLLAAETAALAQHTGCAEGMQ